MEDLPTTYLTRSNLDFLMRLALLERTNPNSGAVGVNFRSVDRAAALALFHSLNLAANKLFPGRAISLERRDTMFWIMREAEAKGRYEACPAERNLAIVYEIASDEIEVGIVARNSFVNDGMIRIPQEVYAYMLDTIDLQAETREFETLLALQG
jgi:hypothetical protein